MQGQSSFASKMQKRRLVKKWALSMALFVVLLLGGLVAIVLLPGLFYKHKTTVWPFTVYHTDTLDAAFPERLNEAVKLVAKSEVYNPTYHMDISLGSSAYCGIIKRLFGNGFAWGFYNKVVIDGQTDSKTNRHETAWNFTQLLAHEMTHCLQFDKLGFFHSYPVAGYPEWKWEGYPEYVARRENTEPLVKSIERLLNAEKRSNNGWITLADSTETNRRYYQNWLLVQYLEKPIGLTTSADFYTCL